MARLKLLKKDILDALAVLEIKKRAAERKRKHRHSLRSRRNASKTRLKSYGKGCKKTPGRSVAPPVRHKRSKPKKSDCIPRE